MSSPPSVRSHTIARSAPVLPTLLLLLACGPSPRPLPVEEAVVVVPTWPSDAVALHAPVLEVPAGWVRPRIYIDAGHGAAGNPGNTGSLCQQEQDFTLSVGEDLARRMQATHAFDTRVSRRVDQLVSYRTRVARAEAWGADVFVSLHSDVRGADFAWSPEPGTTCVSGYSSPGFTILWSDDAADPLVDARQELAWATAEAMAGAGFGVCPCEGYAGVYDADPIVPGVFVDRHAVGRRIYVLRRPRMPSILIETHNARDPREVLRWDDERTRDVFARALMAALFEVL